MTPIKKTDSSLVEQLSQLIQARKHEKNPTSKDKVIPDDLPLLTEIVNASPKQVAAKAEMSLVVPKVGDDVIGLYPFGLPMRGSDDKPNKEPEEQIIPVETLSQPDAGKSASESLDALYIPSDEEPYTPSDEEIQRVLQKVQLRLEYLFYQKISRNIDQLQRQIIEQAVNDLKAELPELIRQELKN